VIKLDLEVEQLEERVAPRLSSNHNETLVVDFSRTSGLRVSNKRRTDDTGHVR
jgi:hypothetical protein